MRIATLAVLLAALAFPAAAQTTYTISGTVVEAGTDATLPGASVVLDGTRSGAATDIDGEFSFTATVDPGTYELRVSFVGFSTLRRPVTLGASATVDVGTLELAGDALRGDEVVVTGSGLPVERRTLGNTIASISAAELESANPVSVDQALAGKVAGAVVTQNSGDPAGGISIRLRGTGTVLGSGDPLYVVDGVIVDNSSAQLIDLGGTAQNRLVDINPADIERIEVVRGAAAAALYGSRANNGVVQIFTKRGGTGDPRVTLQTSFNTNGIRETLAINDVPFAQPVNPANPGAERTAVERFDYQDDIFRQAVGTEQYASVSGGADGTSYFLSGGHLANQGIVDGTLFRRITARTRVGQRLSRLLSLSAGGSFTNSYSDDVPNGGISASYGALTGFIFGPNTTPLAPDATGAFPDIGARSNPRDVIENFDFSQLTNRFTGNLQADLTPLSGLSINALLGVDTYNQRGLAFIPLGTTSATEATGRSRRADRNTTLVNTGVTAQYNADLTETLSSATVLGVDIQNERGTTFAVDVTDLTLGIGTTVAGNTRVTGESRFETNLFGAFAQQTVGIADQLFVTGAARIDASSVFGPDNRWNLYPKLSASYDLPGLDGPLSTLRLRGSAGQTGGLTAIGAFDRFNSLSLVPYVGGGGFVPPTTRGNPDIRPERQTEFEAGVDLGLFGGRVGLELTGYLQNTDDLLLFTDIAPTTGSDRQLTNVGTLKNRGVELLLRVLPVVSRDAQWSSTVTFATNRAVVDLNPDVTEDPDATLGLGGFGLVSQLDDQPFGTFYTTPFRRDGQGRILGVAYDAGNCRPPIPGSTNRVPGCLRLNADGSPVIVPGELDENRILRDASGNPLYAIQGQGPAIIGDPNPDFTLSWINEVELGSRLSFRAQFDGSFGGDIFNFTRRLGSLFVFGTTEDYGFELDGTAPLDYYRNSAYTNPSTGETTAYGTFSLFENWIEDGSFVKLRELSATYLVPARYVRGLGVNGLRATVYGRNLLSFDNYSGYDPETNVAGQSNTVRGYDFVQVPIPRTLGVTLSATL